MPLVIVISLVTGLVVSIKRWRHTGHVFLIFMFLFWMVPYSLIGGKWLRYTLSLMPFVYMLAAVGIVAVARFASSVFKNLKSASTIIVIATVLLFVGLPTWAAIRSGPHYALYTNALASDKAGFYFPHDEFYDDGVREAIKFVCDSAPQQSVIAHETPGVATYYLSRFGRNDLNSRALSASDFDPRNLTESAYFILQSGRTYFENQDKGSFIRSHFRKIHEVQINGATAAEVFTNQN
jgi:hypothetical protein